MTVLDELEGESDEGLDVTTRADELDRKAQFLIEIDRRNYNPFVIIKAFK